MSCIDLCFSSACPKSETYRNRWTFDHSLVDPPAVFLWPHFAIMAHENTHIHNSCTSVTGSYLDTGSVGIKQQMVLYTFIPLSGIVTLWLCSVLVLSSNHRLGLYLKVFFLKNGDQFTKIINHQSFFITEMFLTLLGKTATTVRWQMRTGSKEEIKLEVVVFLLSATHLPLCLLISLSCLMVF